MNAAATLPLLEEDFICPICCDVFKEPVALKCSHSICERCLQLYWSNQEVLLCPICRKQCSSEEPTKNLAFTSLCDNFKSGKQVAPTGDICPEHDEKLKLFCFEDKQPICVVCYTSKKHKAHHCVPVVEAVEELKARVKSKASGLLQQFQILNSCKETCQVLGETIKEERQNMEAILRQEFESLYQFLRDEEEARVLALREEETEKSEKITNRIEELSEEMSDISLAIEKLNQEQDLDDITFLQYFSRNTPSPLYHTLPAPVVISKLDRVKHLGFLSLKLQEKMCKLLHEPPTSVLLDPNTASNRLVVSEDLRSLSYADQKQLVPDNPERFNLGVLGSQGFSSGLHSWNVEVGDNDHWTLGVVSESVQRKKLLKMDPSDSLWSIRFVNGKYRVGVKSKKEMKLAEKPRVIRVLLDCDKGDLTFSDPNNSLDLHAFTLTATEPLFPYFNTASNICPLHIY